MEAKRRAITLLLLGSLPWAISCAEVRPLGRSPLKAAQMSPDSVVVDVFFARFPYGQDDLNEKLWAEIDEQCFSGEVRGRMAQNGMRAGVIGGSVPDRLAQLLKLQEQPASNPGVNAQNVAELEADPRVTQEHKQLRPGQRMEIAASGVYEKVPVLTRDEGDLTGREYPRAQGILAMKAFSEPDGRVRLELTPELHYGDPRQRFTGSEGVLYLDAGRPRRVFEDMNLTPTLSNGQMLIITCLVNRSGSLGHYFFTQDTSGKLEQRLLVVRLSQTQHDELFSPATVLPLDQLEL